MAYHRGVVDYYNAIKDWLGGEYYGKDDYQDYELIFLHSHLGRSLCGFFPYGKSQFPSIPGDQVEIIHFYEKWYYYP